MIVNTKQLKLNKSKCANLELFGINCEFVGENCCLSSSIYPNIINAWVLLSKTQKSLFHFSHCIFVTNDNYILKIIDKIIDNLIDKLHYQLMEYVEYFNRNNFQLTWKVNFEMWEFSFKNSVSGFIMHFDRRKYNQIDFGIINHINFKAMLENFYDYDNDFQKFIINACRKCNSCKACTKGNLNTALFYKTIKYDNNEYNLCPSFPCFGWIYMDDSLMKNVIKCIESQENINKLKH